MGSIIGGARRWFTWFQGQACSGEAAFDETRRALDLLQAVRLPQVPDRAVITLDGPARAQLAGPAAAAQQIPGPRHAVLLPELRRYQVPDLLPASSAPGGQSAAPHPPRPGKITKREPMLKARCERTG